MFTSSTQPQSVFAVLGNSCRLYKSTFFKLLPFSFIYAVLLSLPDLFFHLANAKHPVGGGYFLATLLIDFVILWVIAVMLRIGGCVMRSNQDGQDNALLYGLRKYPIYFITAIIFLILLFVGTILLVFPGIYLHMLLMFYFTAIMLDNYDVIGSLKFSAQLVWGNWWRTFWVVFIPLLIMILIIIFFEVVVDIPVILLTRFKTGEIGWISHVAGIILITILLPWFTSVVLCQYHDLKLRRQAKL